VINNGKEARILDGVGQAIAERLDKRFSEYQGLAVGGSNVVIGKSDRSENRQETCPVIDERTIDDLLGNPIPLKDSSVPSTPPLTKSSSGTQTIRKRPYIPSYRSGAYAILMTLLVESQKDYFCGYMTKREIIEKAQIYCDAPFVPTGPGKFYSGWTAVKTLIEKNLVIKEGSSSAHTRYYLSKEGEELARRLKEASDSKLSYRVDTNSQPDRLLYNNTNNDNEGTMKLGRHQSTISSLTDSICGDSRSSSFIGSIIIGEESMNDDSSLFSYEYVTVNGEITLDRNQATIKYMGKS
jgi:hypothetical protein